MEHKYLPPHKDNKLYSPVGVQNLFKKAVTDEGGDIEAVFNNANKYKNLIELWYASALAVAVYKWMGYKFFMYPSDSPDIHFVREIEAGRQEGFSVEIMSLFDHSQDVFDENYELLAESVWSKKGHKDYDRTELLLVSRLVGKIDVDKLSEAINKYKWNFLRIWLSVYNSLDKTWTLFEISPYQGQGEVGKITVDLSELPY